MQFKGEAVAIEVHGPAAGVYFVCVFDGPVLKYIKKIAIRG